MRGMEGSVMYGTMARMKVKAGKEDELRRVIEAQNTSMPSGYLGHVVLRSDADPTEAYIIGVFESRDAYVANADSPEQHARYEEYRALLDGEPQWHDGEIVAATLREPSRLG